MVSPPVRRVLVGGALRRYRQLAGYALDDAARVLDCDGSKICRVETGQRGIRPKELRELLTEYGVAQAEQEALLRLARSEARLDGWWDRYADVLPGAFTDYVALESAATEIMAYDALLVPDLLQTADYARAIADAEPGYTGEAQRADAVAAKSERQTIVLGRARVAVVLGEAALHQQVGGPDVLAAQLAYLAGIAGGHPAITIQVLPFTAGAHAACGSGPVSILRLGGVPGLGAVRVADVSGGHCLTDPADVACHIRAFIALQSEAFTPSRSCQFLVAMAGR